MPKSLDQLRGAVATIGTLSEYSDKLSNKEDARNIGAEAIEGFNKILAEKMIDDPDFMFERAWMLNRLTVSLREAKAQSWNPEGAS